MIRESRRRGRSLAPTAALAAVLLGAVGCAGAQEPGQWAPDELLVGLREGVSRSQAEAVYAPLGASLIEELPRLNVHRIRVPPASLEAVERALSQRPEVRFVERNRLFRPQRPD